MHFHCVVVAVAVLSVGITCEKYRVIQGRITDTLEFPYQAAIERQGHPICGGAIIGDRFVLTSAHCVESLEKLNPVPKSEMTVRVGHDIAATYGFIHEIDDVCLHPNYNEMKLAGEFDIAVVKLTKPFNFNKRVRPIDLARETPSEGQLAVVTGYGSHQMEDSSMRHLMAVTVPIVSVKNCRKTLPLVMDDMICTGWKEGHRDSCHGDSGGPLVVVGKLAGIVAWGVGCGREGLPGVYTNVAHYRTWIEGAMTKSSWGASETVSGP